MNVLDQHFHIMKNKEKKPVSSFETLAIWLETSRAVIAELTNSGLCLVVLTQN